VVIVVVAVAFTLWLCWSHWGKEGMRETLSVCWGLISRAFIETCALAFYDPILVDESLQDPPMLVRWNRKHAKL